MGLAADIKGSYDEPDEDDAPPAEKDGGDKAALACAADLRRALEAKDDKAILEAFRGLRDEA
jgi:hypothetical protein